MYARHSSSNEIEPGPETCPLESNRGSYKTNQCLKHKMLITLMRKIKLIRALENDREGLFLDEAGTVRGGRLEVVVDSGASVLWVKTGA